MTSKAADPPNPPRSSSPTVPLWLLALFTLSGPIAMHMLVPALPHAARDLGASVGAMQLTISLYILGMAVGQLGYGPVSDRFGRRPVLVAGLILYSVASIAAFFAPTIHALIAARLFQAFGGGAGLALSRAIVRDTAKPPDIARRLALMNLMVTLGPGMAPVIGGALSTSFGWRTIFLALGALGVINLLLLWRLLPETRAITGPVSAATIAKDYRQLLQSPSFIGYAIGGGCATTSMYAFIGAAPFILVDELHRPPFEVGIYLGLLVGGFSLGHYSRDAPHPRRSHLNLADPIQPHQRAGRFRVSRRGIVVAPECRARRRSYVHLHDRRRHLLADSVDASARHQPARYRLGVGALRRGADGYRRTLCWACRPWSGSGAGLRHRPRDGKRRRTTRVLDRRAQPPRNLIESGSV